MNEMNHVAEQKLEGCCGGPAPKEAVNACCARDADAKAEGATGCGCDSQPAAEPSETTASAPVCCG
jgi:hypothetical protein